jgi:hypothetical protein
MSLSQYERVWGVKLEQLYQWSEVVFKAPLESRSGIQQIQSFTETELVTADDVTPQIIWTWQFLWSQGVKVTQSIVYKDNKSTKLLEKNGMGSSSRCTRHIKIIFFITKDHITAGDLELQDCPTDETVGDFLWNRCRDKISFISERLLWGTWLSKMLLYAFERVCWDKNCNDRKLLGNKMWHCKQNLLPIKQMDCPLL